MNERLGMHSLFVLRRILRGDHGLKVGFRSRKKFKNLAALTIPFDAEQDLILCISALPARALWIKIGGTTGIDIFRTIEELPAGCFAVPVI